IGQEQQRERDGNRREAVPEGAVDDRRSESDDAKRNAVRFHRFVPVANLRKNLPERKKARRRIRLRAFGTSCVDWVAATALRNPTRGTCRCGGIGCLYNNNTQRGARWKTLPGSVPEVQQACQLSQGCTDLPDASARLRRRPQIRLLGHESGETLLGVFIAHSG